MEENHIEPDYVMPEFDSILEETWAAGSGSIRKVLKCVSPTYDSYEERTNVINYMQRLIKTATVGVEVFPYGSVPLRTYLPEGDIDLTTISAPKKEDTLANAIYKVLQSEEQNEHAEYEIHDLQFINAEVKLIKCIVGDIIMDLSFNQLGGLCSLCFLEQADKYIRKDHIFKRSIILIKSWCYYESRIIGAHYGLFSTYALEILVLYIVLLYRESLTDPLMVLYRFLEYYSKFDWDNFCMSIDGPINVSSLLGIIADNPINHASTNGECLRKYMNLFIVPLSECETNMRTFTKKYFNIIDPLKVSNNLGRSVYRGSSRRIRAAFNLGARTLGDIMQLPTEIVGDEINKFYKCTLQRHQKEKFKIPAVLTFEELVTAPVTIDHYDDDSETDMSNADYISIMDESSTGGLSERNVPIIGEENERTMYSMSNLNVEQDGLVSDFGNQDENDVFDDDELLDFVTLDGDYMGNVRNLVISHCRHVFARPGPLFNKAPKFACGFEKNNVAGYQTNQPYQQNSSWIQWYPIGVPMQPGPNLANHGVQQFVPTWAYSMRVRVSGRSRGKGPTAFHRQPRRDFQGKDSPLGASLDVPASLVQSPVARSGIEGKDPALGANYVGLVDSHVQSTVSCKGFERKDLVFGTNHEVADSGMQSPVACWGFEGKDPALGAKHEVPDSYVQSPIGHGHPDGASSSRVNAKQRIQFGSYGASQDTYNNEVVAGRLTRIKDEPLKLADELEFPPL